MHGQHVRTGQISRQPEQMRDMDQVATQALENGAIVEIVLDTGIVTQQRHGVKVGGSGPISATFCGGPIRKYLLSRSSRPSARTMLRVYVPTPNSVIRRMSMATLTGRFNHREWSPARHRAGTGRLSNGGRASRPSNVEG